MMTRALLAQALDALETKYSDRIYDGAGPAIAGAFEDDIAAIRAHLAQPEAEPVAWYSAVVNDCITAEKKAGRIKLQPWDAAQYDVPLYAAPDPLDGFGGNLDSAFDAAPAVPAQPAPAPAWMPIESAPRDNREILLSNGADVSSGAWFEAGRETHDSDGAPNDDHHEAQFLDWGGGMLPEPTHWMPLPPPPGSAPAVPAVPNLVESHLIRTAPAVREPLTDDQIYAIAVQCTIGGSLHEDKFARAIEAHHGISTTGGAK